MSDLEKRIGSIKDKLQELISLYITVQAENKELKETVVRLSRELNNNEIKLSKINTELETRQKESTSANHNALINEEVEGYISEINACIEMVNELV